MHWRTRRDKGRFRTQAEGRHVHLSTDVKVFPCGRSGAAACRPTPDRIKQEARGDRGRSASGGLLASLRLVSSRLASSCPVMESDAASAELRKRKREEYEMQLFGFHSRAVYATLKNIVMERIQSRSRKLCETLEKIYKPDSDNLAVLKVNEEKLVKSYYVASVPHLKNIQNIVNKFIAVPDNVLADEDKSQEMQYTETEFENVRGKLEEFQQRARRAAVLNAALKEELQLIEQFSICAENTDKLCHIIDSDVACPDISDKIHQLVEDYKRFSAFLDDGIPVSQKSLYNTINDLKCIDCDMDSL